MTLKMNAPINKDKQNPLVSVIVPCYNHEKYLTECIDSIMNQSYTNFELVVIDDGSKDDSFKVLKELQKKYNFNLIHQKNRGLSATLNRGIQEFSKGKYITFCASDDYWCLDKLEKQVEFMEKNQEFPMCYGNTYYINIDSVPVIQKNKNFRGGWLFDDIFTYKIHPPVNYMYRAKIFNEVGYYNESMYAEDYYMNLKIASRFPIGYLNEYISYYRIDFKKYNINAINLIVDSHLKTIEEYKSNHLYHKAKTAAYLNKFDWLAGFGKSKIEAFKSLFQCYPAVFKKRFWIASIKLFLLWK
jgi:alpha-1,3-rhamnosyltransferase